MKKGKLLKQSIRENISEINTFESTGVRN